MGRKPRVLVPGVLYHVYNRISSGEPVFAEEEAAEAFIELLREVRLRDAWQVLAWCLMSNHYHLVVRSGEAPLWRGMHRLQNVFSRRFNRRTGRTGPLWQSRYQAKIIADERYLGQVIVYVHVNPVRGGAVRGPDRYRYSGHRELLGKASWGVTDSDQALLCFGQTRGPARRAYRASVAAALSLELPEVPASRGEEAGERPDELWFDKAVPYVDELGRSTTMERPEVSAADLVQAAGSLLDVAHEMLAGHSRQRAVSRARRMVVLLGVERWGMQGRDLAEALGRSTDVVSWMVGRAVKDRQKDEEFREAMDDLDRRLAEAMLKARGKRVRRRSSEMQ